VAAFELARSAESAGAAERRRVEETERRAGRELEAAAREAAWHRTQAERLAAESERARASLAALDPAAGDRPATGAGPPPAEQEALATWESRVDELRTRRDRLAADAGERDRVRREAESVRAREAAAAYAGAGCVGRS
jgi:hypothetical protein